jgi:hypothetical protein
MRLINPYQRAARGHHWTPLAVCVVDSLGHSLSMATGLSWVWVRQTIGKNDSRIVRIDTPESVERAVATQQFRRF